MKNTKSTHWPVFGLAMFLLLIACLCPALATINPDGDFEDRCPVWGALVFGWIALMSGGLAWLANPLMLAVAVLLRFKMWVEALTVASIAVGCSLMTFVWYSPYPTTLPGGVLLVGAYFWFAAIGGVWFSSYVAWRNESRPNELQ